MEPTKHYFFVDDSGSRLWDTPYTKAFADTPPERNDQNLNFWRGNYFVLAGVHIDEEKIDTLNRTINEKKVEVFGTKHVEIKSDWLRNPKERRKHYLEPFGITEEVLKSFVEEFWYPLLTPENLIIQAFVLDKRYFASKRKENTPLALLAQILFDRLVKYPADKFTVIFDQFEEDIKSTKSAQGEVLKVSRQEINTSPYFGQYSHSAVEFECSRNSNFLQLADTVAYNIFRQFVDHGDKWENSDGKKLDMYAYFGRIAECFYCSDTGRVAGYGLVKYPDPKKVRWTREDNKSNKQKKA